VFSKIVVGTDGSPTADIAVDRAVALARLSGATLHIVHAYRTVSGALSVPAAGAAVAADVGMSAALLRQSGEEAVEAAQARAEGVETQTHVQGGTPTDVMIAVAEEVGADLIVVGSKGMHRRILGSVPNSIAHNAPCDVLIAKTD
jgi:nucleotide-binding universal stress UspA family protein